MKDGSCNGCDEESQQRLVRQCTELEYGACDAYQTVDYEPCSQPCPDCTCGPEETVTVINECDSVECGMKTVRCSADFCATITKDVSCREPEGCYCDDWKRVGDCEGCGLTGTQKWTRECHCPEQEKTEYCLDDIVCQTNSGGSDEDDGSGDGSSKKKTKKTKKTKDDSGEGDD
jgi:hypothetical protein